MRPHEISIVPRLRQAQAVNVVVQGRHLEISDAMRRYAVQKLTRLNRHFDQIQEAQVVFSVSKDRQVGRAQVVEVTVWGDGVVLRGEHASGDMRASVDGVIDKLEKQIEKYRSRLIQKRRLDAIRQKRRLLASAQAALRQAPPLPREIVRTKRFSMKPMSPEEAIMQLDLLGHAFFVFRNLQSGEVNVVYRRKTGDFGLIEPE